MSPNDPSLIDLTGRYFGCPECQAPNCDPLPERWPLTVRGRGASRTITPHLPTCAYLRGVRKGGQA